MNLRHRLGRGLVLVLTALAVFWTLGEIVTRSLDLVDRLNCFPRAQFVATDEPDLGYRLRANVDM